MSGCGSAVLCLALLVSAAYGRPQRHFERLQQFWGPHGDDNWFKILVIDDYNAVPQDQGIIGGKNHFYITNTNLHDLTNMTMIVWNEDASSKQKCLQRNDQKKYCSNYIRVMQTYPATVPRQQPRLYVCGTNAFNPKCRIYPIDPEGNLMAYTHEESGIGSCPFSPLQEFTALLIGGQMFAGIFTRSDGRDPILLKRTISPFGFVSTPNKNNYYLKDPKFVSSLEIGDKIYFFFREMPIQGENYQQGMLSRVARICKNDAGFPRGYTRSISFTSFFKATLSCSVPGTFPLHFDAIKATSSRGIGKINPSSDSLDYLVYAVFGISNVPGMSAVCAFRLADITDVFKGKFRAEHRVPGTNQFYWQRVPDNDVPTPHPAQCGTMADHEEDGHWSYDFRQFVTSHPLMDGQVEADGGKPVFTDRLNFTCIAVDFHHKGVDGKSYDVLFVGTSDGRVIKSIATQGTAGLQHKVIEDLQVFDPDKAVLDIKVLRHKQLKSRHKLIVVSSREIVSLPLHKCTEQCSCRACVAMTDPYCSWLKQQKTCSYSSLGVQSITTGAHGTCDDDDIDNVCAIEQTNGSQDKQTDEHIIFMGTLLSICHMFMI